MKSATSSSAHAAVGYSSAIAPLWWSPASLIDGLEEMNTMRPAVMFEGASVPSPTAVALSVARCVEVEAARAHSGHPCRPIVTLQPSAPDEFQVPEAWAGS